MIGLLELGMTVDTGRFQSDLGRANHMAQQQARAIKRTLGTVAIALGGALSIGAFAKFTKDALGAMDAAEKLGQKIGVATEDIAGLQLAAEQAGVGAAGMQSALTRLTRNASDAAQGLGSASRAFEALGINVADAEGRLRSTKDILYDSADALSQYEDSAQKTALATQMFGRAGADLLPLLNAGAEGMREYAEMADRMGLAIDSDAAQAAERLNDAMAQLGKVASGVFNQIAHALAPAMADLAVAAAGFFQSDKWRETLDTIRRYAGLVADNLGRIVKAVVLFGQLVAINFGVRAVVAMVDYAAAVILAAGADASAGAARLGWWASTRLAIQTSIAQTGLYATTVGVLATVMVGLVSAVGAAFAGWKIGTYLHEEFEIAQRAGVQMVAVFMQMWEGFKYHMSLVWLYVKNDAIAALGSIKTAVADVVMSVARMLESLGAHDAAGSAATLAGRMAGGVAGSADEAREAVEKLKGGYRDTMAFIDDYIVSMYESIALHFDAKDSTDDYAAAIAKAIKEIELLLAGLKGGAAALDEYAKAGDNLADAMLAQRAELGGMDKAYAEYTQRVIKATRQAAEFTRAGRSLAEVQRYISGEMLAARRALDEATAALDEQGDVVGRLMREYADNEAFMLMSDRQHEIAKATDRATEAFEANTKAGIKNKQTLDEVQAAAARLAARQYDMGEALRAQEAAAARWAGVWEQQTNRVDEAFSRLIESGLSDWDSFGDALVKSSKRFMADVAKAFQQDGLAGAAKALEGGAGGGWAGAAGMAYGGWEASKQGDTWGTISSYTAAGASIGSIVPVIGNAIGALIGAIVGVIVVILNKAKTDVVRMVGSESGERGERTVLNTALGTSTIGSRGVDAEAMADAVTQFDQTIADIVGAFGGGADKLREITDTLNTWVFEAKGAGASGEDLLRSRFAAIMGAFDDVIQGFVAEAQSLEDQVQRLLDALQIDTALTLGRFEMDFIEFARIAEAAEMAGEGVGNAAMRIAHGFILLDAALGTMGISLGLTQRQMIDFTAEFTEAAGGFDRAAGLFGSYFDAFYSESERMADTARQMGAITREALQSIGMDAETGMAEFREAFERNLPEMTPEDIVSWLEVAGALNAATQAQEAYIEAVREGTLAYAGMVASLRAELSGGSGLTAAFADIVAWSNKTAEALQSAARAAGLQGAAEADLALVHQVAARRVQQAISALMAASADLVNQLYGTAEASGHAAASIGGMGQSIADMSRAARDAVQLLIGDYSDLNDLDKLDIALEGLEAGFVSPEQVLEIGRRLYSSGDDYNTLFDKVLGLTRERAVDNPADYYLPIVSAVQYSAEMSRLDRYLLADQLAHNIASLAIAQGLSFASVAGDLGLSLSALADDLGVDTSALEDYLSAIGADEMTFEALNELVSDSIDRIIESMRDPAYGDPVEAIDRQTDQQSHEAEMTIDSLDAIREEVARLGDTMRESVTIAQTNMRDMRDATSARERERTR